MTCYIYLGGNKSIILCVCKETSKHPRATKAHQFGNIASANEELDP
jgi:hypothetical protein